ncbi:MAG: bifunctional glutamate N-acetyltransferase/amino-acid acetyltransferase ArgJ [Pseudomonadota bacterium]
MSVGSGADGGAADPMADPTAGELARLKADRAALDARIRALEGPPVSPLAPAAFPELPAIAGVTVATTNSGLRYRGRDDVLLAHMAAGTVMAGTFTRSLTRSAPVHWCEGRLAMHAGAGAPEGFGLVVNAGNANAFTGNHGEEAVAAVAAAAGSALNLPVDAVFLASTGVIGEPLDGTMIAEKLDAMARARAPGGFEAAARAIMTTDTFPKGASRSVDLGGQRVRISGFAKGSGMIAPDMATMLVFIFTDAAIAQPLLQAAVSRLTESTFNAITVDSDTSTSDTLLVAATGRAGGAPIVDAADPRLPDFEEALGAVMQELAILVVKDGEGATKLVRVVVDGAESDASARRIGLAIANSPLVKTAIAGEDPNWGRIVMAVGKAGEPAERDRLSVRFGDMVLAEKGWRAESYSEDAAAAYMKGREIEIGVDLDIGMGRASVYTCDLTKRYIEINADYRS